MSRGAFVAAVGFALVLLSLALAGPQHLAGNPLMANVGPLAMDAGEMALSESHVVSPSGANVFEFCVGTMALSADPRNFSMPTFGSLQYDGDVGRVMHIACSISFSGANNDTIGVMIAKNGDKTANTSLVRRKIGTGGDLGSTAAHWYIRMSPGDWLGVALRNESDTSAITVETLNLAAFGIPAP